MKEREIIGYTDIENDIACATWIDECDGKEAIFEDGEWYVGEYIVEESWCEDENE